MIIHDEILKCIKRNRISSTEIADCMGKKGAIDDVFAVNRGHFCVGYVRYVYGHSESNWSIHEQIRAVRPGEIVIMDGIQVNKRALVGELVTKFLVLYKEAAALVSLERLRDANDLIKNNYPVWCKGFSPIGCFNTNMPETAEVSREAAEKKAIYDGSLAVCDDTGVVIVPREELNASFLEKLAAIERQEDIWFNCIDFKKWDTFDTVCLKRYEKEG